MRAIEIRRNGEVLYVAGYPRANLLTADLSVSVEETVAALSLHGMSESENGSNLHLWWCNHQSIEDGDELSFELIETDKVTPPNEVEASDSEEFIKKQEEYENELSKNPILSRPMVRTHSGVTFEIKTDSKHVNALLEEPREFLLFMLNWNNFGEERARFSAQSFSQDEAVSRAGAKDWLSGRINLNQKLSVRVLYNSSLNPDLQQNAATRHGL